MKTLNDPEAVTFAQLTQTLSTMGLDDVTVSPKTTLRLGEGHLSLTQTPREFVRQLPQLMDDKSTQTLPEVRVKGTLGKGGMGLDALALCARQSVGHGIGHLGLVAPRRRRCANSESANRVSSNCVISQIGKNDVRHCRIA